MAVQNLVGFETQTLADEVAGSSGTISLSSSTVKTGTRSLRANPTTTASGVANFNTFNATGVPTDMSNAGTEFAKFDFRYATKPAANEEMIASFQGTGANILGYLTIDSSGILHMRNGSAANGTAGTTALSANTWYEILVSLQAGSATAAYTVKLNNVTEITGTNIANNGLGNHRLFNLGKSDLFGNSVDFFYDNLVLDDASFPTSGGGVLMLAPTGAGFYTTWTASSGTTTAAVANNDGDTTYILTTASGGKSTFDVTNTGTAGVYTPFLAAKSLAIFRNSSGSANTMQALNRSNTTDDTTTSADPGATYVVRQKLYATDPATSAAWTTSGLDAFQVGVNKTQAQAREERCTYLACMVYGSLTAPAGGGPIVEEGPLTRGILVNSGRLVL